MIRLTLLRGPVLAAAVVLLALLAPATARAAEGNDIDGSTEGLLRLLLVVVLALVVCLGVGAATLVLRVILPGVARSADASLARLSTKRLFLAGILPLIGAALLARGVEVSGSEVLGGIYGVVVLLPIGLATIAGAMAALPHLGTRALRTDSNASPLARAAVGGVVVGLALMTWPLPPLFVIVCVLLAGWLLGIGLGGLFWRPAPAPEEESVAAEA